MSNNKLFIKYSLVKYLIVLLILMVSSTGHVHKVEASFFSDLFTLPTCIISGKVVDRKNTPISGAEVQFLPDGTGNVVKAITDETGNYMLKVNAQSSGIIIVAKENCRTQKNTIYKYNLQQGKTYIYNFALRPDYISGKIISSNNAPISQVKIFVEEDGGISGVKTVYTDENGNYKCAISADAKYYWVTVSKDGYTILRDRVWLVGGNALNYTLKAI